MYTIPAGANGSIDVYPFKRTRVVVDVSGLLLPITADYNESMAKDYIEQREGVYYVTGTRVSLDSLVYAFHRGESPETIRQNFDVLQLEEVYGALTYYLAHQSDIDVYIGEQERKCQESRRASEPIPDTLRDKLSRMRQNA